MSPTECLKSEQIDAFLAGALAPGEREGVEGHLSGCADCRHRLVSVYERAQPIPAAERAPERLKARARRIPFGRPTFFPARLDGWTYRWAAAGAVFLLVAAVTWTSQRHGNPKSEIEQVSEKVAAPSAPPVDRPSAAPAAASQPVLADPVAKNKAGMDRASKGSADSEEKKQDLATKNQRDKDRPALREEESRQASARATRDRADGFVPAEPAGARAAGPDQNLESKQELAKSKKPADEKLADAPAAPPAIGAGVRRPPPSATAGYVAPPAPPSTKEAPAKAQAVAADRSRTSDLITAGPPGAGEAGAQSMRRSLRQSEADARGQAGTGQVTGVHPAAQMPQQPFPRGNVAAQMADTIVFSWAPYVGASQYQLHVTDEKGQEIFTTTTDSLSWRDKPANMRLERGKTYQWYVRALLPDGQTRDSDKVKLSLPKPE